MMNERNPAGSRNGAAEAAAAERFRRLHELALQLIGRLREEYDVVHHERLGLDAELEQPGVTRGSIALVPRAEEAAPLVVAFTTLPGLHVRFGRWYTRAFPACGCDSCGETFEEERERFVWRVQQLVEGRYREATHPADGEVVLQHEFWSPDGARAGGGCRVAIDPHDPLSIEAALEWQPWVRRWKGVI